MVMSEEPLQRRQGDISLHGGNGEGMPQDVRAHRTAYACEVGHALNDALYGPRPHTDRLMERKVSFYKGLYARCERDNPTLGFAPVGAPLPMDNKTVPLPVYIVTAEA